MESSWALIEQLPLAAYAFRVLPDEFILERINDEGMRRNPGLDALRGKAMAALYRDQPVVAEDARRCATERRSVERILPVRRYDRIEATQNLKLTFVPAPPDHIFLFLQDVANENVAQIALMESEARYQSLIAALPDGILLRGADGRVVFCNERALEIFGASSQAELLGETDVLAENTQICTESAVPIAPSDFPSRAVLTSGAPDVGSVFSLTREGKQRWLRTAAQPTRSATGTITGSVTTLTDITELVQTQRALRESMLQLDLALDAARLGIWQFDLDTLTGAWSPNLDLLFKITGRQRGLDAFLARVHPEDRDLLVATANRLMRVASGDSFEHEFRIVGDDQVTRWARLRGRIRVDSARRSVVGTVMDITEQRAMEEELRRASRLESIGRLAGGIAHDFNNLLAAILGSLDLLQEDMPEVANQDLDTIRHAALRARDLTRQLLAFARKQPVKWSTVELVDLVRKAEPLLTRLVGPSIEIVAIGAPPVYVRGDPSLLEQVLMNLAVNARDAMPQGGKLEIRVSLARKRLASQLTEEPVAEIAVTDSGVGMDEQTRQRAFDPFFTTKPSGTGLGLPSSYGIIQQHGGDITFETQPSKGTCFRVSIPAIDASPSDQHAVHPARPVPSGESGLLLVIDDEEIVRATVSKLARSLGYEVLTCANATESIEQFSRHRDAISAVLCDVAMPERDGPSIVAELRQLRPDVRVVFMSGYLSLEHGSPMPEGEFIQKPFQRAELADRLRHLLGQGG